MKPFCLVVLLIGAAAAASNDADGLISTALKFVKDCNDKSITLCVKVRNSSVKQKFSMDNCCDNFQLDGKEMKN